MELEQIIGYVISFIAGGGLITLITARSTKKKADVEVKVDEIKALHDTIDLVYQPIIDQQNETIRRQNDRINSLEAEVKGWSDKLNAERSEHQRELDILRADHQREMDIMNKRILAITSALGLKAANQLRDEQGRFVKSVEEL
jgi:uncharacterized phage infection (PIP) family protein YhgE